MSTSVGSRAVCHLGAVASFAVLWGCASAPSTPTTGAYEDVLILRSERTARTPQSTWCTKERAGFAPFNAPALIEDRFNFWSVETRAADGRVANAGAVNVGPARACFGATENRAVFNFYLEADIGGLSMSGKGECTFLSTDVPEKGIVMARCTLPLVVASAAYSGGLLVTNSLISKELFGLRTDPPGYTQVSFATVRLWRKH